MTAKPSRAVRLRIPLPRPTEKAVEAWVIDLFKKLGCHVYKLSQPRATMQSEGLPDLWIFCPRRKCAWWWEVKRPGGRLSPAQRAFRERCEQTGTRYGFGGIDEARALAADLQLVFNPNRP